MKRLHAINALKVIAILLVFNSHCGKIYPISTLATGGALGNALFFVISGYLLSGKMSTSFGTFFRKKVYQLYPAVLIVTIVYALIFRTFPDSLFGVIKTYIWPTGYWFIGGLLLFNCLVYLSERLKIFEHFISFSIILWIFYFVCYYFLIDKTAWNVEEHGIVRLIYYFYIFVCGYEIKKKKFESNISSKVLLLIVCISALGSIGWKFVMSRITIMMTLQCICQILGVVFAISSLLFALEIENKYTKMPNRIISAIDRCSTYSLEIYLTQRLAQRIALQFQFPVSMLVAIVITILYSILLKYVTKLPKYIKDFKLSSQRS